MDIKILSIKDAGDLDNERIVLQATNDCNIGDYIVFDTTYDGEFVSNKLRNSYWFPDEKIKKNDKVILYTKQGNEKLKENISGFNSHFFYWDLKKTVWNENEDCAIVVKIEYYITKGKT